MPIENCQTLILNPSLDLVSDGQIGELYVLGTNLARGYFARPGLTAERFIASPYGPSGSRMYKTGDLVRRRMDGAIEFVGRIDHQIKIRGFRVELGEIESTILKLLPNVKQTAVALNDRNGQQALIAYLLLKNDERIDLDIVRKGLLNALPEYMVPSRFVILSEFPLTPNGKIDHLALLELDHSPVRSNDSIEGPESVSTLCNLFAQVLEIDLVHILNHLLLVQRYYFHLPHTFLETPNILYNIIQIYILVQK
jgi:nonribosomal peptide synthetase DhbF